MKRSATIAIAAALLASACSSGSSASQASTQFSDADLVGALTSSLTVEPSDALALFSQQRQIANDYTTSCMTQAGFDWVAADAPSGSMFDLDGDGPLPNSREWAEEYGFGISTRRYTREFVGADLAGSDGVTAEFVDPNTDYVATLSESAQEQFELTLRGSDGEVGCLDGAWVEDPVLRDFTRIQTNFGTDLADAISAAFGAPEVVQAEQDLSRCVAEGGLAIEDPDELSTEIETRLGPVQAEFDASEPQLSDAGRDRLSAIQSFEIELALLVFDCRESVGYGAALETAYLAELDTFVSQNRDALVDVLGA